jgi:hypothetical protein
MPLDLNILLNVDLSLMTVDQRLQNALDIAKVLNERLTSIKNQIPPGPPTFPQRDLLLQIRTESETSIATVNAMLGNDA